MLNSTPQKEPEIAATAESSFLTVVTMTFTAVFLAELGDKTQLATLLLTAQSGRPFIVFLGAALALIFSSLFAVVLGRWLSSIMHPMRFQYIAGIFMIGIGLWLGIEASKGLFY